jgi:hypothetical protein
LEFHTIDRWKEKLIALTALKASAAQWPTLLLHFIQETLPKSFYKKYQIGLNALRHKNNLPVASGKYSSKPQEGVSISMR